jgi:hypothetical protein
MSRRTPAMNPPERQDGVDLPDGDRKRLEDAVVEYVRQMDYVTFAELERFLSKEHERPGGPHAPGTKPLKIKGQAFLEVGMNTNAFVWVGMSQAFARLMQELLHSGRIYALRSRGMANFVDGKWPNLPIAERDPPKGGFKEPHWYPVILRVYPYYDEADRKRQERRRRKAARQHQSGHGE